MSQMGSLTSEDRANIKCEIENDRTPMPSWLDRENKLWHGRYNDYFVDPNDYAKGTFEQIDRHR